MKNSYRWFSNTECKYYPCHADLEEVNCLFCFCPLYPYDNCGGTYSRTEKGVKDCSACTRPHTRGGYALMIKEISRRMRRTSEETGLKQE